MTPEEKTKWVAALRSGKYEQGVGRLKYEEHKAFCCLGVAVEIGLCNPELEYGGRYSLISIDTSFLARFDQDALAHMNDFMLADFKTIADYIETNL